MLSRAPARTLAIGVNVALRLLVVAVIADASINVDDPRYVDKGIGTRGLVVLAAGLLIPGLVVLGLRRPYPVWTDNLYLSIFALDMAGNFLDLYDTYPFFDLLPHGHGTGAAAVVAADLMRIGVLGGIGVAQVIHIALEAQEYYSDVLFDLRNVRGTWDVVNDMVAGVAGSVLYGAAYAWWRRRRPR